MREVTADRLLEGPHADRVVTSAVRGMLPKNRLGRAIFKNMHVYVGAEHKHEAQQPTAHAIPS